MLAIHSVQTLDAQLIGQVYSAHNPRVYHGPAYDTHWSCRVRGKKQYVLHDGAENRKFERSKARAAYRSIKHLHRNKGIARNVLKTTNAAQHLPLEAIELYSLFL